jgi:hypothetical protein
MGSYIESNILAKLLLPENQTLNIDSNDEIRVKPNLGISTSTEKPDVSSKIKETFTPPFAGIADSWSEMDFMKDYITPSETSEKEEKTKVKKEEDESIETTIEVIPEFKYLDPENMDLEYEFGLCNDSSTSSSIYTIHLCGFTIQSDGDEPFLKYMFELYEETYHLPYFDFTCPSNIADTSSFISWIWNGPDAKNQTENDDESSNNTRHVYFLNECLKRIINFVDVNDHSDPNVLKNMYKGFLQDKTDPNQIYAFFDFGDNSLLLSKYRRTWAIIDEIVNVKKIYGFGIQSKTVSLFRNNVGLSMILKNNNVKTQIPYVMYLCKMENGEYVNVYNEDETDMIYEERTMHPIFGRFFIFSVSPLDYHSKNSIFQIERYAVFTNDPIYFLRDTTDPLFFNPDFDDSMKGENNESIYFRRPDGKPFWCIKSSDDFNRL